MMNRKADRKANRSFLNRWEVEYMFTHVQTYINTVYICGANVAITKEHNIRRHCETKHRDKYKDMTQGCQKVEEMKRGLVS